MSTLTDRIAAVAARLQGLAGFPLLESDTLVLRPPCEADVDPLFRLFSDPETLRYWSRPAMLRREEAATYISEIRDAFARRSLINWIIAEPDQQRMLGTCTLYDLQPSHLRCAVGYALLRDCQGRGTATLAVELACQWAMHWLGLHRVEADIHPDNQASRRVLQRAGFQCEGLLRQRFVTPEEIQDSEIHARLRTE